MKRVLLCAALIAWSGIASAVVYKWVDSQGKLQYGDRPPDGVHAEVVELVGTRAARSASSTAAQPPSANSPRPKAAAQNSDSADSSAKQAVAADVAQTREKQCTDAQERYKKLIEGRKLFKTGADGERHYLTSEEIDSERVNAKSDLDAICNSPT
ncbi:MAG: DUF4124 domain-containing protein [Pseudomonadota bacterium]|nr:DUF4124 domain-containing protein [Pseudomonadota bacterium]